MPPVVLKHTSKFVDDFRNFAVKGNAVDLAVGVIIGGAFGKIVSSLVADVVMPPLSLLTGKVNFTNLFVTLSGEPQETLEAAKAAGAVTLNYGQFLQTVLDFTLVALAVFVMIRLISQLKQKQVPPPPDSRNCPRCLSTVKKAATKCAFCTVDLEAQA